MAYYSVRDVSDIANEFLEAQWDLTPFEALQLALQYHRNEVEAERTSAFERAFGVSDPSMESPLLDAFDDLIEAIKTKSE